MFMKKFTSLFTLICALFITTATAQVNQTAVFDFVTNAWEIPTIEESYYTGVKEETVLTDGTNTVSTTAIGITDSHIFENAKESQSADTIYELVVGNGGGSYSSVVFISYIKVYPAASDNALALEAPVFDNGTGVISNIIIKS